MSPPSIWTASKPSAKSTIGGASPRGLGVTADGKLLVVAARDKGDLVVVDLQTRMVIKRIPIGKNPEFVRVRGDQAFRLLRTGLRRWSAAQAGLQGSRGTSSRSAPTKRRSRRGLRSSTSRSARKTAEITGGMETEGIEFSADGNKIIVTNEDDNNLTVHDIASGKLLNTIDTRPYGNRPARHQRWRQTASPTSPPSSSATSW
jgi:YVTN family beta-propeller protein